MDDAMTATEVILQDPLTLTEPKSEITVVAGPVPTSDAARRADHGVRCRVAG